MSDAIGIGTIYIILVYFIIIAAQPEVPLTGTSMM